MDHIGIDVHKKDSQIARKAPYGQHSFPLMRIPMAMLVVLPATWLR